MIKTTLTPVEIQRMIEVAPCLRDKVIIACYSDTGMRASELLKITVDNLDLDKRLILIPHLKRGVKKTCPTCHRRAGRHQSFCSKCGEDLSDVEAEGVEERSRLINFGEETRELLREYTREMKPSDSLIALSRQQVYFIVRDIAKRASCDGKLLNPETRKKHYVHPHSFRDSLAVSWLEVAGSDVGKQKALQMHLGHKNFETTMRYNKLTPENVRSVSDEVRKLRFGG